jgi:hypothetical protein
MMKSSMRRESRSLGNSDHQSLPSLASEEALLWPVTRQSGGEVR